MAKKSPNKIEYENQDINLQPQQNLRDIFGVIKTVSEVPTGIPRKLVDQQVIYVSGATQRFYVCNLTTGSWLYTNLT